MKMEKKKRRWKGTERNEKRNQKKQKQNEKPKRKREFEERINFAPEADPTLRLKKLGFAW